MNEWSKAWCTANFAKAVRQYRIDHDFCAVCGIPEEKCHWPYRNPPGLQLAHIFGGPSRKDHPAAVLALCERCHRHEHTNGVTENGKRLPSITKGVLLTAKQEQCELDLPALSRMTGYQPAHIEGMLERIPPYYMGLRGNWR